MDLLPQLLTVLGHPRDVTYNNLVALKSSFVRLKLALIDAAPVSRFVLFTSVAWCFGFAYFSMILVYQ